MTFTKDEESYKIASLKDIISVNTKKKRKWRQNIHKIIACYESARKSKPLGQQIDEPPWREQDTEAVSPLAEPEKRQP